MKRYDPIVDNNVPDMFLPGMEESPHGDYVDCEDVSELLTEAIDVLDPTMERHDIVRLRERLLAVRSSLIVH